MTTSTTTDAGQDLPGRRPPRSHFLPRPRRGRLGAVTALLVLTVAITLGVDAALVTGRIDRFPVQTRSGPGTTWVVVGLDSRADLPEGASAAQFGTTEQVPGARADVVLVVHRTADHTSVLSVPRDLVVGSGRAVDRLALSWLGGPQRTVDALCGIGIPTDHLLTVDLRGFTAIVDAAGGLDIDVPEPVRDPAAGLQIQRTGRVHVDGRTALALVRSRHPEHFVEGAWTPAPVDPDGRATAAGEVLSTLAQTVPSAWHPWRTQRVAWAAAGAVSVDESTSAAELAGLAGADLHGVTVLPASQPPAGALSRFVTHETLAAISDAGMSCHL